MRSRCPILVSPPNSALVRIPRGHVMPMVVFRKDGKIFSEHVAADTNLVVRAGIKCFPFPYLAYRCGMGKCASCACRVLVGAEHLPPPNLKEKKQLGERLAEGYRLICQLWLTHDIEISQDIA